MTKTIKIGLLGLGTVGGGVPKILEAQAEKIKQSTGVEIVVAKGLVRDEAEKALRKTQFEIELTTNYDDIVEDEEIDIIIELIGKLEPARTFISRALKAGKHVVTANKDLLAQHGLELIELAGKNKVDLYYEASVAGGIPILRTLANSLADDGITKVQGIVNGTTNYMLTKMVEEGQSYEEALAKAQELGFAESDPTNDVDGIDAAYKMVILTQFAYGMNIQLEDVARRGIRHVSIDDVKMGQKLGYVIKLVGETSLLSDGVAAEVAPMLVPVQHPLAAIKNEMNAVFVESMGIGESMYYGPGAGSLPTATSIVADVVQIAKNIQSDTTGVPFNPYHLATKLAKDTQIKGKYYFAIKTPDRKGQILKLAEIFTKYDASFEQVLQQKANGEHARVVAISHTITNAQFKAIKAEIEQVEGFKLINTLRVLGK
ncbi:MAG: homoserine dehydrogenase [Streptococcaceae bacterium]|jgi:homoserine dehydrogenase|nr:homoserine dehydrogenase [Streptococcaceae bacterium]